MSKTIDIVVPDLGDFENVEVIEVLVSAGDTVEREDGLVTIETDTASMDIPAPENGVIDALTVGVGDTVSSGDVIGRMTMEVGDTVVIAPSIASAPTGDTTVMVTPAGQKAKSGGGKQTLIVPDIGDFADVDVIEVHIAPGDSVLYFASFAPGGQGNMDVYRCSLNLGVPSSNQNLPPPVNGGALDCCPVISNDGQRFYICSDVGGG